MLPKFPELISGIWNHYPKLQPGRSGSGSSGTGSDSSGLGIR